MIHQIITENITRPIVKKKWAEISRHSTAHPFDPPFEWKMIRNSWVARYMWGQIIAPWSGLCLIDAPSETIVLIDKSKKHDMVIYANHTFYIVNTRYLVDPMCLSLTDPKELICMLVKDFVERPKEIRWM